MKTWKNLIVAGLLVSTFGCGGGGSNNDQGVSFTFLGWNSVDDEGLCQFDTFIDQITVPISTSSDIGSATTATCASAQNNICTQGVRIDRTHNQYYIPGATEQPPTTTLPMGATFGPVNCGTDAPTSSLPSGYQGIANKRGIIITTVPGEIREWISTHRNSLPPLPFMMTINVTLSGVTTAGKRLESNPLDLQATVLQDIVIDESNDSDESETGADTEGTDSAGLEEVLPDPV